MPSDLGIGGLKDPVLVLMLVIRTIVISDWLMCFPFQGSTASDSPKQARE